MPVAGGQRHKSPSPHRGLATAAVTTGVGTTAAPSARKPFPTRPCSSSSNSSSRRRRRGAAQDVRPELPGWAAARPLSPPTDTGDGSPMDTITHTDQPSRAGQGHAKDCTNLTAKLTRTTAASLQVASPDTCAHAPHTHSTHIPRREEISPGWRGEGERRTEKRNELPADGGRYPGGEPCSCWRGKKNFLSFVGGIWGREGGRVWGLGGG